LLVGLLIEPDPGQGALLAIGLWVATTAVRLVLWGLFRGIDATHLGAWFDGAIGMLLTGLVFATLYFAEVPVGLDSALWISAMAGLVAMLFGIGLLLNRIRRLPRAGTLAPLRTDRLIRVGLPIMVTQLSIVAMPQAGLWVLAATRPLAEAAQFGVAVRLMLAASFVFMLGNQIFGPLMAGMVAQGKQRELERFIRRTTSLLLAVCVLVALPLLLLPKTTIAIVFGETYVAAAPVFVVLILAQIAQVCFGPAQMLLQMADRERGQMMLSVLAFGLSLALTLPLSNLAGSMGAAIATGLAIVLRAAAASFIARRQLGILTVPGLR
jgi:O-antigen/teichoic acid export membrane protein